MFRKFFAALLILWAPVLSARNDREYWVDVLDQIARPVISNLAAGTLRANMPFESLSSDKGRMDVSHLEAFGRTVCGISAWLELGPDNTPEGQLRAEYIKMTRAALANATNPQSPDYLTFDGHSGTQALVDAAFLAQGLLHAPTQLWMLLDSGVKQNLIACLKQSREIRPYESNWLLFASIVEAALLEFTGEYDAQRLNYGVDKFMTGGWYKGDGIYSDGADVHLDFYNSLVIHPMLTDILKIMQKHGLAEQRAVDTQLRREQRLSAELERVISPEGTYPAVGRSITYRFGSFHALAHTAWMSALPQKISPAQVRCALTAVISRQLSVPGNFDADGWLTVGFAGHQLHMSEDYINTGSQYLCCAVFLPLGLPASDPFWSAPDQDWTNKKAWSGIDVGADKAL